MKVVLTYAEPTSHALALVLADWLPRVLHHAQVEVWAPGANAVWQPPGDHRASCICVTPEALAAPQLYHAAGAAYPTSPEGIAVPVALDLEPEDLAGTPLTVLQATTADRSGLLALVATLCELGEPCPPDAPWVEAFERSWPHCEDRLGDIPGTLQRKIEVTVASDSFLQTFPYSAGQADGLFADTLIRMLDMLSDPGSPIAFPSIDHASTRLLDVEHERWITPPKLLSRLRTRHIAFVDASALSAWGDSPWLLSSTIRSRAGAGRAVAQGSLGGAIALDP